MQPESDPTAGRNRGWWIGILVVACAMVALAVWAWWIPNGVYDPGLETFRRFLQGWHILRR